MRVLYVLLASPVVLVLGCSRSGSGGSGTAAPPATSAPATTAPSTPAPAPAKVVFGHSTWPKLTPSREAEDGDFATSVQCSGCHGSAPGSTALQDAKGRNVAPYDLWQATLMANAARDPLFRAEVSVEIQAAPTRRAQIESECLSCHTPAATSNARARGTTLGVAVLSQDTPEAQLALDGVSCSFCHQQDPDPTKVDQTFNGLWKLGTGRQILGPYDNPYTTPMSLRTMYVPAKGANVRDSSMCASCHTLFTAGPAGGVLAEQTPFLEWQNSVYGDPASSKSGSCQSCHVPTNDVDGVAIKTTIAHASGGQPYTQISDRTPFGRHVFVGGNTLVPAILKANAADLSPLASPAAFDAVIDAARTQLATKTATLALGAIARSGDTLTVPVTVRNEAGHKFPTGHPTRRAWIELKVTDASGATVFHSGGYDAQGRIVDRSGKPLPSELAAGPLAPHRSMILDDSQVQVYESVLQDAQGQATYLLLSGEGYLKDDRILPEGWSDTHPAAAQAAPRGTSGDAGFVGGAHTLSYSVNAPAARGPFKVEATVLYQPLGARFAAELFSHRTPEVEAFESYYSVVNKAPEVVARAQTSAP